MSTLLLDSFLEVLVGLDEICIMPTIIDKPLEILMSTPISFNPEEFSLGGRRYIIDSENKWRVAGMSSREMSHKTILTIKEPIFIS